MKALPSPIRVLLRSILSSVFVLSLTSCAHRYPLTSPTQVCQLPVSRGINGGSYTAPTKWQYRGSRHSTHEFRYYYHIDNLLYQREITIPRRHAVLHFPEFAFGAELQSRWVTLGSDACVFHFSIYQTRTPCQ